MIAVGLGPAGPQYTTPAATTALLEADVVFLRTGRHPAAEAWLQRPSVVALDHCYEGGESFEEVYRAIVGIVVAAAVEKGSVAYGVPGSPAVAERTIELLRAEPSVELELVAGMSFCELAWARLGLDPIEAGVRLVDGESFPVQAAGDAGPLLVAQCWNKDVLSAIKLCFDDEMGPAVLLHHLGLPDEAVLEVPWAEIDRTLAPDHLTSLYVPQVKEPIAREMARLVELVRVLRERCPWDREQTHSSLVQHMLEETYEAMEAIEALGDDPAGVPAEVAAHVSEELGDLLCQVLFHACLAEEEGLFDLSEVARGTHDKLVARHPHVFGDAVATSSGAVLANWERNKQAEKKRTHLFEGIPAAMPALARAAKVERKLASFGLGWEETGLDAGELVASLAALFRLVDADDPLVEEAAVALGMLVVEQARLVAHRGGDLEGLVRKALDHIGARVAAVEAASADQGLELGALDAASRLELWRASATEP